MCSQGCPDEIMAFYGMKKLSSMLGGDVFKERVRNRFTHLVQKDVSRSQILAVAPHELIGLVCSYFNLDEILFKKSRRGIENLPRDIAIYLSRCYCRKTLAEIGGVFAISNESTVSCAVERIKNRNDHDGFLQRDIDALARMIIKSQGQTCPL